MATLNEILGDQYKEGMTTEEIETALAGVVLHTDAEVKANFVTKKLYDKTASDLAASKRNGAAAAGQAQADLQSALDRIAQLENDAKESARQSEIAKTSASLLALGYSAELAEATATAMVDGDRTALLVHQTKYAQDLRKSIVEENMKGTLPPAAGGTASGGTSIDYAKAKADALAAGNDAEYMRLCREEAEAAAPVKK